MFVISDIKEYKQELDKFDLGNQKSLLFAQIKDNRYVLKSNEIYDDSGKFLTENFKSFLKGLRTDSLIPHVRSEALDAKSENGVKIVVGSNFEEKVINSEMRQLIFIYSEKDKQLKEKTRIIEEVASHYKNNPNFEVVKIEGNKNEIKSSYSTDNLPNIYFKLKKKVSPARLGEHKFDKESLIAWIEEQLPENKEDL